jgi:5'-nucleotidase
MRRNSLSVLLSILAALALAGSAGCSSDDGSGESAGGGDETTTTAPTTTSEVDLPTVLVTNDDGVGAEGIDALVNALVDRGDVEVVVVAPLENQSGSGGKTTEGELVVTDAETLSGHPAKAVGGFPADTVVWALGEGGIEPDLVISGINDGQNVGPLVDISGTVGAARQAAQMGVPAVATSQGLGDPADFPSGVEATMAWLDEHLEEAVAGELGTEGITSINIPTCTTGEIQGVLDVPVAVDNTVDLTVVDCTSEIEPTDDVTAFVNGWVAVTELAPTGSVTE